MAKLKGIYELVMELLISDPKYRDDDNKLTARIWSAEIHSLGKSYHQMSGYDFLCLYAKDWITSADSITRARRKIQEYHPELRGATYNQRQQTETMRTKEELREISKIV